MVKEYRSLLLRIIATLFIYEGVAMLPSLILAYADGDGAAIFAFAISSATLLACGFLGKASSRKTDYKLRIRESYFVLLVAWITVIAGGMLPYLLISKGFATEDVIFESVASWTTSSAWVINVDTMPRALVLWKATSSWLGGMGIIMVAIIILSQLGVSSQKLIVSELPGTAFEKNTARTGEVAKELFIVYAILTVVIFFLLLPSGMPVFDSLINTLSSVSTTGVIDYHGAVREHFTSYVKVVLVLASIASAVNFMVYVNIKRRRFREAAKDFELKVFLAMIACSSLVISGILLINKNYSSVLDALINGLAGTVSFGCTSGFPLERIGGWPSICKIILFAIMAIGGSAGSTSGGIKVIRVSVMFKLIRRGFYKRIHPNAVKPVMIGDKPLSPTNAQSISTFILIYVGVYLFSCMVLSLENLDIETTITTPMSLISNCGVGFGRVIGGSYQALSPFARIYASILMMLGRLEVYAGLILFSPAFWKNK